jgi:hypothetical protein|tara:strand:+ start:475 stop:774 length:300 start_codon:yes stop_codon:yes gene_type:complete
MQVYSKNDVYALSEKGLEKLNPIEKNKYISNSDKVLLDVTSKIIKIYAGASVAQGVVFPNIIKFATNQDLPLEISFCENIRHLKYLDKLVYFYNKSFDK